MKKKQGCALVAALMMLSCTALAVEENVVVELPALDTVLRPSVAIAPNYGPDSLAAYYWDDEGGTYDYQVPGLREEERRRAEVLLSEYEKGLRPSGSILNVTENVVVGVYELDPAEYNGERAYVLLPIEPLTDGQLLGIIDAYAQLGLAFQPDGLNHRNCARGGGVQSTRFFITEERERQHLLEMLYRRQELRPETPLTPLPKDDGVGLVKVNRDFYAGVQEFQFIPYRQVTDEELLSYVATQMDESISYAQFAAYEQQARSELRRLVRAPLALELQRERMVIGSQENDALGDSPVYSAAFKALSTDPPFRYYYILLDPETGVCKYLFTDMDQSAVVPWDFKTKAYVGRHTETAEAYVEGIRRDGGKISLVEPRGSASPSADIGACVSLRVVMEDGGKYDLLITLQHGQVIEVEYTCQTLGPPFAGAEEAHVPY